MKNTHKKQGVERLYCRENEGTIPARRDFALLSLALIIFESECVGSETALGR